MPNIDFQVIFCVIIETESQRFSVLLFLGALVLDVLKLASGQSSLILHAQSVAKTGSRVPNPALNRRSTTCYMGSLILHLCWVSGTPPR